MDNIVLKYVGIGRAFVGIPARDLTADDLKQLENEWDKQTLIASGLYVPVEVEKKPAKKSAAKDGE